MKRADLVVGKEYLLDTSNEWETNGYMYDKKRVVVLDTGGWIKYSYYSATRKEQSVELMDGSTQKVRGGHKSHDGRGSYVVVAEIQKSGRQAPAEVASLISIRGEWEPCIAKVHEFAERKAAANQALKDKDREMRQRIKSQCEALSDHGIKVYNSYVSREATFGTITLTLDEVDGVLERLK